MPVTGGVPSAQSRDQKDRRPLRQLIDREIAKPVTDKIKYVAQGQHD
jgi:hypothetical protein